MNLEQLLADGSDFPDKGMYGEALKQARKKKREALMEGLVETATQVEAAINEIVGDIRSIRRSEKIFLTKLEKMNRAKLYLEETGNPLPFFYASAQAKPSIQAMRFCQRVGVEVPSHDSPLWEVPKDWQPSNS